MVSAASYGCVLVIAAVSVIEVSEVTVRHGAELVSGVGVATFKSKRVAAIIEGRPVIIVHNGKVFEDVLAHAQLTHHELMAALRQNGCGCVEEVQSAILENNGAISVVPRSTR